MVLTKSQLKAYRAAYNRLPNDVEAAIEFLLNTGMFLLGLVNHKYQVRVDPTYALAR